MGPKRKSQKPGTRKSNKTSQPLVAVIMGSDSDWRIMKDAGDLLEHFGVPYERAIVSAHRTPHRMVDFAEAASERGIQVIIAGAGGAAHLPGMVASLTSLPVIGVPVKTGNMDGLDALLSIVQMPKGIPVATVAVDNSSNAALLALRILALNNPDFARKLAKYISNQTATVIEKARDFGLVR